MDVSFKIIAEYQSEGVVVLRKIISDYWLKQLSIGIKKNFTPIRIPSFEIIDLFSSVRFLISFK